MRKREFERALSDLNPAIALDPKVVEAWSHRGAVWFGKQDFTKAIADFDEALRLNLRLVDIHCNRGIAWLGQGNLAEAEKDFARCCASGGRLQPEAECLLQEMRKRLR